MRVLMIEDDRMIGRAVTQALTDAACTVECVHDAPLGAALLRGHAFDILLLDLGLPSGDGLDVLGEIRGRGDLLPVIVITARDGFEDRIAGLDLGADDYIVKPFNVDELLARMRAVCRRRVGLASSRLQRGEVTLDLNTKRASSPDGSWMLSRREFALLRELMMRPSALLSRRELEERIYGVDEAVESNAIDFLIHGLRRKVGSTFIRNVRGLGWTVGGD